jgi:hypothetical protein
MISALESEDDDDDDPDEDSGANDIHVRTDWRRVNLSREPCWRKKKSDMKSQKNVQLIEYVFRTTNEGLFPIFTSLIVS